MSVYVTVGAIDATRTNVFYDAVLATIGWRKHAEFPGWRAYSEAGTDDDFVLWVCRPFNGELATPGNGTMIGFKVKSRAEVDAFYQTGLANGGTDEGAPDIRPQYSPYWYAAYMRDPSRNKLAVVFDGKNEP